MAPLSGTAGSAVLVTGGTPVIAGIAEWSLDIGMSPVETTAFGDNWDTYLPSVRNYTGSFSGNADNGTVQTSLRNAMLGGSAVALRLYDSGTTYFNIGTAYLNGMSPSISQKGKADVSFSFTGSGPLTYV